MTSINLQPIGLRRLYHQRITHPRFKNAGEVVAWLGAMQAQDYLAALWAVGVRMQSATEGVIEQAIAERRQTKQRHQRAKGDRDEEQHKDIEGFTQLAGLGQLRHLPIGLHPQQTINPEQRDIVGMAAIQRATQGAYCSGCSR